MADIDKPLPNTKTTVEVPGEVEIEEAIKEKVEEVETQGGLGDAGEYFLSVGRTLFGAGKPRRPRSPLLILDSVF